MTYFFKNKLNIYRAILILLILAVMVFIYLNSAQNSTKSSSASKNVSEKVVQVIVPEYNDMTSSEKNQLVKRVENPLRTFAHGAEFCLLAFFVLLFTYTFKERLNKNYLIFLISFAFCFLYACSDEFHQKFVQGRACEIKDVFVDSVGILFGCLFSYFCIFVFNRIKKNRTLSL